jgi:large subunit ribosomal protein L1
MKFSEAITELRTKTEKRNFEQTLDLIINLRDFDLKRDHLNVAIILPFPYKKKKIAAFLENESFGAGVDHVISKSDIEKIDDNEASKLARGYDFFIASAKLMPLIAKHLGKSLGIAGKMPDPALGAVLVQESSEAVAAAARKLEKTVRIRAKEASLKIAIGKETTPDDQIEKNASAILNSVIAALPKGEYNIRSVILKFTMSPTVKVKMDEKIIKERKENAKKGK